MHGLNRWFRLSPGFRPERCFVDKLRAIQYFVAAVREGSLSAAARRLARRRLRRPAGHEALVGVGQVQRHRLARRLGQRVAERGEVLKMHGAAALPHAVGEAPFERRMRENSDAKRAIAAAVAATIRDGDSIMMDTGTTTSFLARELLGHRRLTVVTNSSDIARTLSTVNGNKVYMAGGELRSDNGAAFGSTAIDLIVLTPPTASTKND